MGLRQVLVFHQAPKEDHTMKKQWLVGWLLTGLSLCGLVIVTIHLIPAYIQASRTFPNEATWQTFCNWFFLWLIPFMFMCGGIIELAILKYWSRLDKE